MRQGEYGQAVVADLEGIGTNLSGVDTCLYIHSEPIEYLLVAQQVEDGFVLAAANHLEGVFGEDELALVAKAVDAFLGILSRIRLLAT